MKVLLPSGIFFMALLFSCSDRPVEDGMTLKYRVANADEWNDLFIREQGWFGGDGIFAIPLNNDTSKQLIIFSDTMLGLIKDGQLQKGYHMLNNSVAYLKGKKPLEEGIEFPIPQDENGKDLSIFPVQLEAAEPGEYFWLGDGLLNPATNDVHIFAYRVIDRPESPDQFKFEVLGGALITLPSGSEFPFKDQSQTRLPFFENHDGWITSFGAGIFENIEKANPASDGYIYIYGVRDPNKQVIVGRVQPDAFLEFDQWRFWNGRKWDEDFTRSATLADSASNELSVSLLPDGRYALVFQLSGIYPTVGMRIGSTPVGPFDEIIPLWDCTDALEEKEFFTYNAKAHPSLSAPGELLVSYNVNSFAFWNQIEDHPHLYRPRFIKLIFEK